MVFQLALFEPCKCSFKHHTLLCEEDSIISWILLYSEVFQQHSMGEIYILLLGKCIRIQYVKFHYSRCNSRRY